ncbi:PorP/SprF family type IX secretion system membrane protein [Adhaeribacter radiodurans]|uniref:Outer membrane beta-barrel protein n=1 Tax=Adhaeribacter radiodurans TaxID=2745197 RepID=A0A7L7LCQ6_9BACT|nr:hypothetical protein [Adhaeribacter radiodurans]QMU30626.1 hypothetical protein HUW48_22510 [Adhaeribacter radiodurans]
MKQLAIITTILFLAVGTVKSQQRSPAAIGLYASFGLREVNATNFFINTVENPSSAYTIGAGYSWRKNRLLIGTEFHFANKHQENSTTITHHAGFNSAFLAGYKLGQLKEWSFYPILGVGVTQNKLLFSSKSNEVTPLGQSSIYAQHAMILSPALSVEKINAKGMLMGFSIGYSAAINGKQGWEQEGSSYKTPFHNQPGGFFIQVKTGGLIRLEKK